jgi:PKD repeat protein
LAQANAVFDDVLDAGSVYHLADHPNDGHWHDGSFLLQHLDHVKGRSDVWYVPFGQLYQYRFIQEMREDLSIQHVGATPLVAAFSASPLSGTSPLSVAFTDASSGAITGWRWDFGDSVTSTERNPVHVYTAAGSYAVRLTVTGSEGVQGSTRSGYVVVTPPSVDITEPANGALYAAPASITFTATPIAGTGVAVSRVEFYAGSMLVGSDTSSPYSFTWRNVAAGNYSLTARVVDSLGRVATSIPVGVTVVAGSLPPPWATRDIGGVGLAGSAGHLNGKFVMSGSGVDIWGSTDAFRYVYQTLTGDGQITARVAIQQNTNAWAKSGVMIRETLSSNSRNVLMALTPGNGSTLQRRLSTGGTTVGTDGPLMAAPYWVKLTRSGNTFTSYVSTNGSNWALVGSDTIAMAETVYVGLAVTSHTNSALCTVIMDAVTVSDGTPVIPPSVDITAPANGMSFDAPASITITATATAGTGASVSRVEFYNGTTLVGSDTASHTASPGATCPPGAIP